MADYEKSLEELNKARQDAENKLNTPVEPPPFTVNPLKISDLKPGDSIQFSTDDDLKINTIAQAKEIRLLPKFTYPQMEEKPNPPVFLEGAKILEESDSTPKPLENTK